MSKPDDPCLPDHFHRIAVFCRSPCDVHNVFSFEASQECWDVFLNPLEAVATFHSLGNMGLIKCQDVAGCEVLLSAFSDCHCSDVGQHLFS